MKFDFKYFIKYLKMSIIRKNGNKIEFFDDDLIYRDYENQKYIEKILNDKDKSNVKLLEEIKNEKLKCVVKFKYIDRYYTYDDTELSCYHCINNTELVNFEKCCLLYETFELHFTENHIIFVNNTTTVDSNCIYTDLFKREFTDELKKQIIEFFTKQYLKEYQIDKIYPKFNEHLFGRYLLEEIYNNFIESITLEKSE